jgi:hypothetical protein
MATAPQSSGFSVNSKSTLKTSQTSTTQRTTATHTTDVISLFLTRKKKYAQQFHSFYETSPLVASALIRMTVSGSAWLVTAYSSKLQSIFGMVRNLQRESLLLSLSTINNSKLKYSFIVTPLSKLKI